jgi:hypothetical protein
METEDQEQNNNSKSNGSDGNDNQTNSQPEDQQLKTLLKKGQGQILGSHPRIYHHKLMTPTH